MKQVNLRVEDELREGLEKEAKKSGLMFSEYCRAELRKCLHKDKEREKIRNEVLDEVMSKFQQKEKELHTGKHII